MNREKGDVLEDYVADTWPGTIQREANSGAKYGTNDLRTWQYSIECKRKLAGEALTLSANEIKKCKDRAGKAMRNPAWVVETALGKFIVLDYDDYCTEIYEATGDCCEREKKDN